MQIIIPMSGQGSRFAAAGYNEIKPLITVMGKPIIEWVCDLFPGAESFLFICREEHLRDTGIEQVLRRISPDAKIKSIPGHKLGPVYAVAQAFDLIEDHDEAVVSYCDYYMNWDFRNFRNFISSTGPDGCIPCYTGFHPHLLYPENVYAVCKTDDSGNLADIREKHRFHPDAQKNMHSAGLYYFKSGSLMKHIFSEMLGRSDLSLNGEFYVSLAYRLMIEKGMRTNLYSEIPQFCQWGTPRDLEEFNRWEKIFKNIIHGNNS